LRLRRTPRRHTGRNSFAVCCWAKAGKAALQGPKNGSVIGSNDASNAGRGLPGCRHSYWARNRGGCGRLLAAPVALMHHDASSLETAYGNAVVNTVARVNAAGIGTNLTTADARTLQQGRESYTGSCSQCHGASAQAEGVFGRTSFPPATDLSSDAMRSVSDGQMFYIIKNGLGFTPMPAFGAQYSDNEIWTMVTFIRSVQQGQESHLDVPTPTTEQLTAANITQAGEAYRGAEAFAALGCASCHQSSGALSIHPANDGVERAIRGGERGMPCWSADVVPDGEVLDIRTYIATFPTTGILGAPRAGASGPPSGGPPAGQAPPSGATTDAGSTKPCSTGGSAIAPTGSPVS